MDLHFPITTHPTTKHPASQLDTSFRPQHDSGRGGEARHRDA
jgi:hypothetical protein